MSTFVSPSDHEASAGWNQPWEPLVIPRADIKAEAARLAEGAPPQVGGRESLIVHPRSTGPGRGLAPGIRVTLSVLLPGETTPPIRQNSTEVSFCIGGGGTAVVGDRKFEFGQHDVWTTPAWTTRQVTNDTEAPQVRLTYSNAALLDQLGVHMVDIDPVDALDLQAEPAEAVPDTTVGIVELAGAGALLMPYEIVISPPNVAATPLHWPWPEVKDSLDRLTALGEEYRGRRLYLLYDPRTGRTNGTTPSFFATITVRPPKIVDRPHRHVSAAINYYFRGSGHSIVGGKRYDWEAGDLMFSAPGWMVHHHVSGPDEQVYELTIQDQPYHLALDSLLWQEDLKRPARLLGAEPGFETNRGSV